MFQHGVEKLKTPIGNFLWSEDNQYPSWQHLRNAPCWKENTETETMAYLRLPVIEAKRLASDELAVHIVEAAQTGASVSVTVYSIIGQDVPAGVAAMTPRAVVCDVIRADLATQVELCAAAHIPTLVYGYQNAVTAWLDKVSCDTVGTRVVEMQLFIKPKVPSMGKGMKYRHLAVAILADPAALQPQVCALSLLPPVRFHDDNLHTLSHGDFLSWSPPRSCHP